MPLSYSENENSIFRDGGAGKKNRLAINSLDLGGGTPPPAHNKIGRKPILNILSNAELVQYGISKGYIQNGDSAKDLVAVFRLFDQDLGNFMMHIVEYNIASKRGRGGKAFSATGKIDGIFYKNPREYLQKIKEKVIDSTSEFDVFKTFFGIKQETQAELISTLTNTPNTYKDPDKNLLQQEAKSRNQKIDTIRMFLGGDIKDKKVHKLIKKHK